jgi:hypothetical protein
LKEYTDGTSKTLKDADCDNTYWRRIITIQPILTKPQTTPAGGKEKARKPRNKKLNEEFY